MPRAFSTAGNGAGTRGAALDARCAPRAAAAASRRTLLAAPVVASTVLGMERPGPALCAPPPQTASVPKRELAEGLEISQIVKGNWQLSGGHRGSPSDDRTKGSAAVEDFEAFVQAGITTFDTADIYGPSEGLIGKFIRSRSQGSNGIQILTKCCKFGNEQLTISKQSISEGISRSLSNLNVPTVDCVQFYWNDYSIPRYTAAAQYLMDEVGNGRVRHIGVTNFDVPRMEQMMKGGVRIVSNQVQYSLLDRRPENRMVDFCKANNIRLLPFGTVAGGFLSDRYLDVPKERLTLNTFSKQKYASIISQNGGWGWFQELLHTLKTVAQKHNTSIANVAGKWVLDKPLVPGVIVGARNANHVQDHVQMPYLMLDEDDTTRIAEVLAKGRQAKGDVYDWERGGIW